MLDPVFEALSLVGSLGLVWLVIGALLAWRLRRRLVVPALVATVLAAELASGLLKLAVGRQRPPDADPTLPQPLLDPPSTHSFPSGHASVSFACATVLAWHVPRLAWPAFALAALVAWSRVWVGVHYPLDVAAGAVLGVALAFALRAAARALRSPAAGPRRSARSPRRG